MAKVKKKSGRKGKVTQEIYDNVKRLLDIKDERGKPALSKQHIGRLFGISGTSVGRIQDSKNVADMRKRAIDKRNQYTRNSIPNIPGKFSEPVGQQELAYEDVYRNEITTSPVASETLPEQLKAMNRDLQELGELVESLLEGQVMIMQSLESIKYDLIKYDLIKYDLEELDTVETVEAREDQNLSEALTQSQRGFFGRKKRS